MVNRLRQIPPNQLLVWLTIFCLVCLLFVVGFIGAVLIAENGSFSNTTVSSPTDITQITAILALATTQATLQRSVVVSPTVLPSPQQLLIPEPTSALVTTPILSNMADPWVEEVLEAMSLEQKIGQMLMMGVEGKSATPEVCQQVSNLTPGAIVYRTGNASDPDQLRRFSEDLQECAESAGLIPLWIAMDHEGQYVNRFESGATVFPAAMAQGATADPTSAYHNALLAGQELAYSGINMVLGPVADVLLDYDNSVISTRSFGGDTFQVSQFVSQAVAGYLQSGLTSVVKHFPGHGGVSADTHYEAASDPVDLPSLREAYLPPFQSGLQAGASVVMFGHVTYPTIDGSGLPATLSPTMVSLLREELGFQGVILTDSMGMAAITSDSRSPGDAALQAVNAGVDMLLASSANTAQASYDTLVQAVQQGTIPIERINLSVRRILTAKSARDLKKYPVIQGSQPDWEIDQQAAFETGYRSVALLKDATGLIPLPANAQRILIIGPVDGWGLYPVIGKALERTGHTYQLVTYSGPWNGPIPDQDLLERLPTQAAGYDLTIVFTWDAHINHLLNNDSWQVKLVERLHQATDQLVVVGLKSPTDLLEFPQVPTFLATFGTTAGQIQGLVDSLVGIWIPTGSSPLPGLP